MPRVSVIIPVHNRIVLLKNALESVFQQTFQDYEVVIVDDGSDEWVSENIPPQQNLRIIRHNTNKGAAAARNSGIIASKAEYIAFLDSDDEWLPEKLAEQVHFLENNSEFDACTTGYQLESDEGNSTQILPNPSSWLRVLAKGCALSIGTTLMVRRTCYEKVGVYDEGMIRHEDYDWLMRFVKAYQLRVLQQPLAIVKKHGKPPAWKIEVANNAIVERYGDDFLSFGRFFGHQAIGKRWLETAVLYHGESNRKKGNEYLIKAILENPIQRPGMYIRILDGFLGTSIVPSIKRIKGRILSRIRGKNN